MLLEKEDVTRLFEVGGYTINERFKETGFIYFPTDGSKSKESPNQGRVFWHVEEHAYPDTVAGRTDKHLDQRLGMCRDVLSVSPSWERATDKQDKEIRQLLKHYVIFCRQQRDDYVPSIDDQREPEEGGVE